MKRKVVEQMDGLSRGIEETISHLVRIPSQLGLPNPDEVESYNCKTCGKEIKRMLIPFLKRNVFPVCRCVTLAQEKYEEQQERILRKQYMERTYKQNLMNESLKT